MSVSWKFFRLQLFTLNKSNVILFFPIMISMKIIHIDDSKEIRELYSEILVAKNHSVKSVYDGKKGLELVAKNDYDLILLDMYMPKYSGIEFLRDLKNTRPTELKKVIIVSLLDFKDSHAKEFLKFGIHSILKKPMNLKELENIEKDMLRIKKIVTV